MKHKKIKLGSKVRCKITGYEGIATIRSEFLNGCVQYNVTAPVRDNKPQEDVGIDVQSLEVIKAPKRKKKSKSDSKGGPNTKGRSLRGY